MIIIGFTCTGTFQLWLNCAQNFAKENAGWADPSIMQTWYSAGTFIIGWAGAGGLLQIVTLVCNMLFPKIRGTVTALVMIASSLCKYTILTAASKMQPAQVMTMNIVLTAIGVLLGLFVNIRYSKMLALADTEA